MHTRHFFLVVLFTLAPLAARGADEKKPAPTLPRHHYILKECNFPGVPHHANGLVQLHPDTVLHVAAAEAVPHIPFPKPAVRPPQPLEKVLEAANKTKEYSEGPVAVKLQELESTLRRFVLSVGVDADRVELEARARYHALYGRLTQEERIALDEEVAHLTGRSFREEELPRMRFSSEDPSYDTLRDFGRYFTSQRHFDAASTLPAVIAAWRSGKLKDPSSNEGFWADHGDGHKFNVADTGVQLVEGLHKAGVLKLDERDLAALKIHVGLLGMTHDLGMKDPLDPNNRRNHWRPAGELLMGAEMNGFESQQKLAEDFIQRFSQDEKNPMNQMLLAAASTPEAKAAFGGKSPEEIRRVLLREMFLANFSHGSDAEAKFDPVLGIENLGTRRGQYLTELNRGMYGKTYSKKIPWDHLYGQEGEKSFMFWADPKYANLPPDHPLARLREVFTQAEGFLNAADANRGRGPGKLYAPGNKQMFLGTNSKGQVVAYGVVTDPLTGAKVVMEIGARPAAGLLMESAKIVHGTDGQPAVVEFPLVATEFQPEEMNEAADQAGRVIGETYAYILRGLGHALQQSGNAPPKLVVPYPGKLDGPHAARFQMAVDENIAKVFLRNKVHLPADVLRKAEDARKLGEEEERKNLTGLKIEPDKIKSRIRDAGQRAALKVATDHIATHRGDYWSLRETPPSTAKSAAPPKFEDEEKLYQAPGGKFLTADETKAYADRLRATGALVIPNKVGLPSGHETVVGVEVTAEHLLEGAKLVTLPPNTQVIKRGTAPGTIYLLVEGTLNGTPDPGSGLQGFSTHSDPKHRVLPVMGATSTLATSGANGRIVPRSADVFTGPKPTTVLIVPPETARIYWSTEAVALSNPALIEFDLNARRTEVARGKNRVLISTLEAELRKPKGQQDAEWIVELIAERNRVADLTNDPEILRLKKAHEKAKAQITAQFDAVSPR